jgi:hypothetical protein
LLINHPRYSTDFRTDQLESSSAFKLDEATKGWLLRLDADGDWRRMCWLPHKRREDGQVLACSGQRVVIGAQGGLMTILDFSDMI